MDVFDNFCASANVKLGKKAEICSVTNSLSLSLSPSIYMYIYISIIFQSTRHLLYVLFTVSFFLCLYKNTSVTLVGYSYLI